MCKLLAEEKENTLLVRLQVCLTKCRQAAQLVRVWGTETWEEGLVCLLPTHVSCTFLSLLPFLPLLCIWCRSAFQVRAVKQAVAELWHSESLWQAAVQSPEPAAGRDAEGWGLWRTPLCAPPATEERRISCGYKALAGLPSALSRMLCQYTESIIILHFPLTTNILSWNWVTPPSTWSCICCSKTPQDALSLRGQDVPTPFDAMHTKMSVVGKRCTTRMLALLLQSFPALPYGRTGRLSERLQRPHRQGGVADLFETTVCSLFCMFSRCHLLASGGMEKLMWRNYFSNWPRKPGASPSSVNRF